MKILPFHETESGTWTYLLADSDSGHAAIIDPVWVYDPVSGRASRDFIDQVLEAVTAAGYQLDWVLETHAHADHLSAAGLVRAETGARIAIGQGIRQVQENFKRVFNLQGLAADGSQFDRLFAEGDTLRLGGLELRVIETPGHTDDSITYLVGDAAFIGDTLFAPGYGTARCDFPGGDAGRLFDSIQKLYALPGNTRLHLCHDYPDEGQPATHCVTVDESRTSNKHVRADTTRAEFVAMREARDKTLSLPRLILPSLQVNVLAGSPPPPEDNGFSYLKTPFNTTIPDLLGARSDD
ncbi:MAG: MBL fold metallo-hydrolase [Xanthomonadales bacterium]|nr:MBL fold metallo-hydrolase [Xanthomonadales bacterium]